MGLLALLILGLLILLTIYMAFSGGVTVSYPHHHDPPPPFRQRYFAQLRYDARRICAEAAVIYGQDFTVADPPTWKEWSRRVDKYLTDQQSLEQSRHITTPNYQDMANVVCPQ